jgi:prepilin-type N-terminal cleavage/methylation domain-containing protein
VRKGFSLIEMISVIALLAILSLGLSRLYTPVISDNPYTMRLFSTNDTLIAILKQIRDDIENATSLPKEAGEYQANENTLIIQLAKTTIVYRKNNETITRQNIESPHTIRWNIPKAIIDC